MLRVLRVNQACMCGGWRGLCLGRGDDEERAECDVGEDGDGESGVPFRPFEVSKCFRPGGVEQRKGEHDATGDGYEYVHGDVPECWAALIPGDNVQRDVGDEIKEDDEDLEEPDYRKGDNIEGLPGHGEELCPHLVDPIRCEREEDGNEEEDADVNDRHPAEDRSERLNIHLSLPLSRRSPPKLTYVNLLKLS